MNIDRIDVGGAQSQEVVKTFSNGLGFAKDSVSFYVFLPLVALFGVSNIISGYQLTGSIEVLLLITGLCTFALKSKLSGSVIGHICVAHITLLSCVLIFFPSLGGSSYLWVVGLPVFTSYLLGFYAALRWSVGFFLFCVIAGFILMSNGVQLYWAWDMAPFLLLVYIVITIFALSFGRRIENSIADLKESNVEIHAKASMLAESELRYRILLESSMNPIAVHSEGKWVYANAAYVDLLGADSFEQLKGISIFNFIHPDHRSMVVERMDEMQKSNQPAPLVEQKLIRFSGREIPAEIRARPIIFDGKASILVSARDITEKITREKEQEDLQQQWEHSQRLESLGVLAGGIAHDFNNLLAAISGNAELMRFEIHDMASAIQFMDNIDSSCDHAANLCKQMLAYAGKGKYVLEATDMNQLVKSMSKLIRASVSSKVTLKVKLDSALPMIECDVAQMQQIILNFIVNSAEAIGDEVGEIKVSTGTVNVDKTLLNSLYNGDNLSVGMYAVLDVRDTGCGMDEVVQRKIFDPFFTTKDTGSGLGLSAILGIVRAHDGAVQLHSKVGKGTTFRVFIPLSRKSALESSRIIETGDVKNLEGGGGLVLIVDDDVKVRQVASAFVKKLFFDVVTASDGQEGVDTFRKHHNHIKAVLLDMTMPILGGVDAMHKMRAIDPSVPIIMVSGYSEVETGNLTSHEQPDVFLQKPFRYKDVKKVLYKVMSE